MAERVEAGSDPRRWVALGLLGAVFFMSILDGTIVYVAIPSIEADLGFTGSGVQWVMSSYLLTFGGMLLLGGRLADLLGRRRVFVSGVALFTAASLLCGLAWAPEVLVGARVLQGLGAAAMAPAALALVLALFEEGPERNKALGFWGALGGFGGTAGLLIGGPLTHGLGWEWVFFVNLPVGIAALALTPVLLRESRDAGNRRNIDFAGAVTITGTLLLVVYAVTHAPEKGWLSGHTLGLFAGALALFAVFLFVETKSAAPLVPLGIFRSRTLTGGNIVLLVAGICVDGMLIIVTLHSQQILGYSALQFGLMTTAMTATSIAGAFTAQAVVTKAGFRPVAVVALGLIGAGSLLLSWLTAGGSFLSDLLAGLMVFGAGLGAAFVAAQIAAVSGVPESEHGLAAGLTDTSFSLGGALGLAILTTVAASAAEGARADGADPATALVDGFGVALTTGVGFAVAGLVIAFVLLRPSPAPAEETPAAAIAD